MRRSRRGIGLVEVIVVLGLLALLIGLLLPAVQSARDTATRADCENRLHQIGIALLNYESSHGSFPPRAGFDNRTGKQPTAIDMLNWMTFILPEIEQNDLWTITHNACQVEPLPYISPPHLGFSTPVKLFICPADPRLLVPAPLQTSGIIHLTSDVAMTSYIGSAGTFIFPITSDNRQAVPGAFGDKVTRIADITDGTSQTIMVGERPPPDTYQAGQWYQAGWQFGPLYGPDGVMDYLSPAPPGDTCSGGAVAVFGPGKLSNPCDRMHYWSLHRGGANFLFCDGSVQFLPYSASTLLPALLTRAKGDVPIMP